MPVYPRETKSKGRVDHVRKHVAAGLVGRSEFQALGGRIDAGGLKRPWQRLKKTTGLATRFHDLRHAHASLRQ